MEITGLSPAEIFISETKNDFEPVVRHTDTSAPLVWKYSSNTGEIKQSRLLSNTLRKNLYFTGKMDM